VPRPILAVGAAPEMWVCSREVLGPVVAVTRHDDLDHVLRMANDSRSGLQASVFTADFTRALTAECTLDFDGALINEVPTWRADQQPYRACARVATPRRAPPGPSAR